MKDALRVKHLTCTAIAEDGAVTLRDEDSALTFTLTGFVAALPDAPMFAVGERYSLHLAKGRMAA